MSVGIPTVHNKSSSGKNVQEIKDQEKIIPWFDFGLLLSWLALVEQQQEILKILQSSMKPLMKTLMNFDDRISKVLNLKKIIYNNDIRRGLYEKCLDKKMYYLLLQIT